MPRHASTHAAGVVITRIASMNTSAIYLAEKSFYGLLWVRLRNLACENGLLRFEEFDGYKGRFRTNKDITA